MEPVGSDHRPERLPSLVSVSEYEGQAAVTIAATQLGTKYTATQAARIVSDWVEFFSGGATPITELHFRTRTPRRLFAALESQVQLQALFVKWGDYEDLAALQHMSALTVLALGGASHVSHLTPLARLSSLRRLQVESLLKVRDASPLRALTGLTHLEIGGDWQAPRTAHVESIAWLTDLTNLEHLLLHTLVVDDLDYAPLLQLSRLKAVRVMRVRGMQPSREELQERLPWSA